MAYVSNPTNSAASDIQSNDESNDSEPVEEPWFVYICVSKAGHYYTGISVNPRQRVHRHNAGSGSKMAKDQGQFTLKYVTAPFPDKSSARKREVQLKGWSRSKKEKLISGEWT